ncbi:MAG: hypothetical protein ACRDZ7_16395, partial [Acidimicrobiia bacterium]
AGGCADADLRVEVGAGAGSPAGPDPLDVLPRTGAALLPLAGTGVGLLLAGTLLVRRATRRRSRPGS